MVYACTLSHPQDPIKTASTHEHDFLSEEYNQNVIRCCRRTRSTLTCRWRCWRRRRRRGRVARRARPRTCVASGRCSAPRASAGPSTPTCASPSPPSTSTSCPAPGTAARSSSSPRFRGNTTTRSTVSRSKRHIQTSTPIKCVLKAQLYLLT